MHTSQVSNIVTICEICVQEPSRLGCFSCGRTGICLLCRTERTGRTGDGLLRRFDNPMSAVQENGARIGGRRQSRWAQAPAALLSLRLGIDFFSRLGRRKTTRAKSYVILYLPIQPSSANQHPARCGFAACCRLRVSAGFDRNCRRPRRRPVMSYSPQPLPRQA